MSRDQAERGKGGSGQKKSPVSWPDWHPTLVNYRNPDNLKATWQVINTFVPYCGLWYLMIRSIQLDYSYLLTLLIALPAAAFLVRIFILFHDCVHGSLFSSKRANTFFGYFFGVLVFTAFEEWRFIHLRHHGTYANLDARGFGDVWTLTRQEYQELPKVKQFWYRLYRNPLVLLGLGAIFNFLLHNRLPDLRVKRKERMSVLFTNLLIVAVALTAARIIGWQVYLLIQLPVLWLAGAGGIWLFYVQHQFAGVYWARKKDWQPLRAAMEGCSFYKLPTLLRWFSGNIGYHHVHHLNPMVPNYQLKNCYEAIPALQAKAPLTISASLSCLGLKIWDEELQEMVAFP
jgi:omega-6 fatty acid desaturase (delta-12 desaturase)